MRACLNLAVARRHERWEFGRVVFCSFLFWNFFGVGGLRRRRVRVVEHEIVDLAEVGLFVVSRTSFGSQHRVRSLAAGAFQAQLVASTLY